MQITKTSIQDPNFGLKIYKDKNFTNVKKYWKASGWSNKVINNTIKRIEKIKLGNKSQDYRLSFSPIYRKTDLNDMYIKEDVCKNRIIHGVEKDAIDFTFYSQNGNKIFTKFLEDNNKKVGTYRNTNQTLHPDFLYSSVMEILQNLIK